MLLRIDKTGQTAVEPRLGRNAEREERLRILRDAAPAAPALRERRQPRGAGRRDLLERLQDELYVAGPPRRRPVRALAEIFEDEQWMFAVVEAEQPRRKRCAQTGKHLA